MVASRNQMHVMHRAFGSTRNGSLEPFGAEGEMNTYLNGRRDKKVGLNGYSGLGNTVSQGEVRALAAMSVITYAALDFPGARPFFKAVRKQFREPKAFGMNVLLVIGLSGMGLTVYNMTQPEGAV